MKLTKEMCEVIADLEYEVGSQCYNPKSYDGWNDIEGCEFRYPVNFPSQNGELIKARSNVNRLTKYANEETSPATIRGLKYKFGANELYVGKGLINVLEYLEARYNLDFESLEAELQKKER